MSKEDFQRLPNYRVLHLSNYLAKHYYDYFSKRVADSDWLFQKDSFLSFFLINYNLLSYIDKNLKSPIDGSGVLSFDEAKNYSNILRSLMTNELLFLIYLNISLGDYPDYKKLVEKYSFLEHMNLQDISLDVFTKLMKNVDIDAFGDKRRLDEYFSKYYVSYKFSHALEEIVQSYAIEQLSLNNKLEEAEREVIINNVRLLFCFDDVNNKGHDGMRRFFKCDAQFFLDEKNISVEDLLKPIGNDISS